MGKQIIEISSATILKIIFWILFFWFLYLVSDVILILILALIIASAISPIATWLSRYLFSRILSVIIIYVLAAAGLAFIFYLIVPVIFQQGQEFIENIPKYYTNIQLWASQFYPNYQEPIDISKLVNSIKESVSVFSGGAFNFLTNVFGGIISTIIVVIISFWFAVREEGIENFLREITPSDKEEYILQLWQRIKRKIGLWLQGQLLLSSLVGLLVFFGLTILGVPYALVLGILAGIMELLPYIGPILASLPAIIIGFVSSPLLGFLVLILYFVIQRLENDIFLPLVMQKIVGVSPILVIIALLIGTKLLGFLGLIIAVPVAAAATEIYNDLVEKKEKKVENV